MKDTIFKLENRTNVSVLTPSQHKLHDCDISLLKWLHRRIHSTVFWSGRQQWLMRALWNAFPSHGKREPLRNSNPSAPDFQYLLASVIALLCSRKAWSTCPLRALRLRHSTRDKMRETFPLHDSTSTVRNSRKINSGSESSLNNWEGAIKKQKTGCIIVYCVVAQRPSGEYWSTSRISCSAKEWILKTAR